MGKEDNKGTRWQELIKWKAKQSYQTHMEVSNGNPTHKKKNLTLQKYCLVSKSLSFVPKNIIGIISSNM